MLCLDKMTTVDTRVMLGVVVSLFVRTPLGVGVCFHPNLKYRFYSCHPAVQTEVVIGQPTRLWKIAKAIMEPVLTALGQPSKIAKQITVRGRLLAIGKQPAEQKPERGQGRHFGYAMKMVLGGVGSAAEKTKMAFGIWIRTSVIPAI
jgi:hypothetical protein